MISRKKKISRAETRRRIHSFRGIFKLKPGEKSVVQELIEERRAEKKKEEREFRGHVVLDTTDLP